MRMAFDKLSLSGEGHGLSGVGHGPSGVGHGPSGNGLGPSGWGLALRSGESIKQAELEHPAERRGAGRPDEVRRNGVRA